MKKENRLSDRTRSPEPDDLTREAPPRPPATPRPDGVPDDRRRSPNPDVSAPHVPPHE